MPEELEAVEGATFSLQESADHAVLEVAGEIDMVTSPALRERLTALAQVDCGLVVLDLTDVGFFDSSGLNAVVAGHRVIRHHGGDLRIVCTSRRVIKVFEIAGLTRVFVLHATVQEALRPTE